VYQKNRTRYKTNIQHYKAPAAAAGKLAESMQTPEAK